MVVFPGVTARQIFAHGHRAVAEGVFTAPAVLTRAKSLGVELPICAAIDTILHDNADIDVTIAEVLARPYRAEL